MNKQQLKKQKEVSDFIKNIIKTFIFSNDGGIYRNIIHSTLSEHLPSLTFYHEMYDNCLSSIYFNDESVLIMQIDLGIAINNTHSNYIITFYNDHYSARICDLAPNLMLEELLNSLLTDSLKKQFKEDYDIYLKPIINGELYDY